MEERQTDSPIVMGCRFLYSGKPPIYQPSLEAAVHESIATSLPIFIAQTIS
jgi:hypothetical protein